MAAGGGGSDLVIDAGTCSRPTTQQIQAGSYLEIPFAFNKTFTSAPSVVASLNATRASTGTYFWKATVSVTEVTTSGGKVVVGNPTTTNFGYERYFANWVAIGN